MGTELNQEFEFSKYIILFYVLKLFLFLVFFSHLVPQFFLSFSPVSFPLSSAPFLPPSSITLILPSLSYFPVLILPLS